MDQLLAQLKQGQTVAELLHEQNTVRREIFENEQAKWRIMQAHKHALIKARKAWALHCAETLRKARERVKRWTKFIWVRKFLKEVMALQKERYRVWHEQNKRDLASMIITLNLFRLVKRKRATHLTMTNRYSAFCSSFTSNYIRVSAETRAKKFLFKFLQQRNIILGFKAKAVDFFEYIIHIQRNIRV